MNNLEQCDIPYLTQFYRTVRQAREAHTSAYNKKDEEYKELLYQCGQLLIQKMGDNTSISNHYGSVRKVIKQKFWSTDWDEFRKFVVAHDAVALIENRIQQTNMAAWLQQNPDKLPPGLQMDRRYDVVVSKPRTTLDLSDNSMEQ
jgi:hypothetical protein